MNPLNKNMSVAVPTVLGKPDYRTLLQELVLYATEEFSEPSPQLRKALDDAKRALARGEQ